MENYIMLNGKRIDLTAEQIETLVGKKEKDPFERVEKEAYFYIDGDGCVEEEEESWAFYDNDRYLVANYCTDRELMEQRALHETLNRMLWRHSMQHGGREIEWDNSTKWSIYYGHAENAFHLDTVHLAQDLGQVYFIDSATAKSAIEEIVKPFMEKHPEFRW